MIKLFISVTALIAVLLTSCSQNTAAPLRIGTNLWPGYEPLYLARELGYLDENTVRLVEYTSTSQVLSAYRNGLLDAAAVTLDEAIKLADMGEQSRILLVTDISHGADALLGQTSLNSLADIKGKKIGVEHTALGAYFINRVIEIYKINRNDITLVPLEAHQHERAFDNREIDAVVTFEPMRSKILARGAHVLFDSSQISGEIVDVIIIKKNKLEQFKTHIEHLTSAWYLALNNIAEHPNETASILGQRMKLGNEDIIKMYKSLRLPDEAENMRLLFNKPQPDLLHTLRKLSKIMYENKLINSKVEADVFLNLTD